MAAPQTKTSKAKRPTYVPASAPRVWSPSPSVMAKWVGLTEPNSSFRGDEKALKLTMASTVETFEPPNRLLYCCAVLCSAGVCSVAGADGVAVVAVASVVGWLMWSLPWSIRRDCRYHRRCRCRCWWCRRQMAKRNEDQGLDTVGQAIRGIPRRKRDVNLVFQ